MISETQLIRRLMMGDVICTVTDEAAVGWLQSQAHVDRVNEGLGYVGMMLGCNELKSYFYASYQHLRDKTDESNLRKRLQEIVDIMHPLFQFLDLVTKANHEDTFPSQGHHYLFSGLLVSIENNEALAELLVELSMHKFFSRVRSKTNIRDRLTTVMDILVDEGLLFSDGSGMRYEVTGKFDYYLSMYHHLVSLDNPAVIAEDQPAQHGLLLE